MKNPTPNNKSYSEIIRNTRKEEDSLSKDILNQILQRLSEQDQSIKILTEKISKLDKNTKITK